MEQSVVSRAALVVLAVIATCSALLWLSGILTPLVLALFLTVLIDSFARYLQRSAPFLPQWADLPLALVLSTVGFAVTVWVVVDNTAAFSAKLLADGPRLNRALVQLCQLAGIAAPPSLEALINQINPSKYLGDVAKALQSFASGAVYVFIYAGFMIASRQGLASKVDALWPDSAERATAIKVFSRIRDGVESYLWIQTVTGAMIAVASFILMQAMGLENAAFWAFLIFIIVFIPVVGGLIAAVLPPLFALVQFSGIWQPVLLFCGLQVILFVVGSIILPRMQRDGLNIDPVVVLLSLAFWGAMWGIPGMFLSTPLTVTGIIVLAQFEGSRWIAVLLSGDGRPEVGEAGATP
jgi:predicted PurR-regulated permease PerM